MSDPFKDALRKADEISDTPEIDAEAYETDRGDMVVSVNLALEICFQRNEARELLASEKATRNAIIAKGIETERQLAEARDENARLREALANATCLILAVGEPKETEGHQHGWYEARKIVLEQVNKLTP